MLLFVLFACDGTPEVAQTPAPVAATPAPAPAAPAAAPAAAATATSCSPTEKTLFSCATASGKLINVCGDGAKAQYRYGPPEKVELAFPADSDPKKLTFEARTYPQFQANVLAFTNDGTTYEVTDAEGAGGENGESNNFKGVYVIEKGATIASVSCAGAATTDWDALKAITTVKTQ